MLICPGRSRLGTVMCGQKAPVLDASAEEDQDLEDDAQARKKKVRPASELLF